MARVTPAERKSDALKAPPQKAKSRTLKKRSRALGTARDRLKPMPTRAPSWTKSKPIALKPDATVDDAIAVVVTSCLAHWKRNLGAAVDGRAPEGLHQVRVSLRRLRSALTAFKAFIPPEQRETLNTEAKWLLSALGPVRDLDVFVRELAAPLAGRLSDSADLVQLMRAARAAQKSAQVSAARALESVRAKRFAARIEAWRDGRGWRGGETKRDARKTEAADFAKRLVNRRVDNILTEFHDVEALKAEERHELRIAVKKTRYAIEFLHDVLPAKRAQRLAGILKSLQDSLGHLNDIEVAERTVSALVNEADSGLVRRQIATGGSAVGVYHKDAAADAEPLTFKLWRKLKKAPSL